MGMGEPLHNYDETMKALRILTDEQGLAVSPRRITLSTVGLVPALERLAHEPLMPNLAISLHATTDEQRDALVPINRKYGSRTHRRLPAVPARSSAAGSRSSTCCSTASTTRPTTRDGWRSCSRAQGEGQPDAAERGAGIPFERPSDERVDRFARILADRGVTVSVRKSRGRDIRAACGQLIVEGQKKTAGQRMAALMS